MVKTNLLKRPEFYDIFGFVAFIFVTITATWSMASQKALPLWSSIILLVIGLLGLIVDGTIVFKFFFKKKSS